jgi:hypothetical protein
MKNIYKYFFIYLFILYLLVSYFFFPYLSSIINPTNIFYINNEYFIVVLFCILVFFLSFILIKRILPMKHKAYEEKNSNKYNLIFLAYGLFAIGLLSKILNIFNNNHLKFIYSDINSKLFIIEYISSMNILSLLSLLFFIAFFYNNKISYKFFYFLIPILYFIAFLMFSPGGRINLIIIFLFVFTLEIFKFSNLKLFIFKILTLLLSFLLLFNFMTFKKDAVLLNYIGIHVQDLNKKIYFSDLNMQNSKISDVLLNENLVFFVCEKNIEVYKDKTAYSKYDICKQSTFHDYDLKSKQITKTIKISNTDNVKEVTFNNRLQMNILSNLIYNLSTRLNNYRPLSSALYIINNQKLEKRSILSEYKVISFRYLNVFLKYFNIELAYQRNFTLDNFNIKSGITKTTSEAGLSPTLIGDVYWIGGYLFLFLYFIKISVTIYFLNYIFISYNLFYKTVSFFLFIQYVSTFEQSFEAHSLIFLNNLTILFFCITINSLINRFNYLYLK